MGQHEPAPGFARPAVRRSLALLGVTVALTLGSSLTSTPASAVGVWSTTPPMTTGRSHHVAVVLEGAACAASTSACGKVLIAGGRGESGSLDSVEVFDPSGETWSLGAPMTEGRARHAAVLLDGNACSSSAPPTHCGDVLVVGGVDTSGRPTASTETFDPGSERWTARGSLAIARAGHTATLLPDGRVLVVGGAGEAPPEFYDPLAGSWSSTEAMGVSRSFGHTATLLPDGSVLVAGGIKPDGSFTDAVELYDASSNTWSPTAPLAVARTDHTATSLLDGQVMVAGGRDETTRRSTEIYDPDSRAWTGAGAMSMARSDHTATVLPNGRVLAAGGGRPDAAAAEIFDPGELRWTPTASLRRGRLAHTATPLSQAVCDQDCAVLVVGGLSTGPLRSSELFDASAPTPPGRVTDLKGVPISPSEVKLTFSAPGINDGGAPPVSDYVVKQAHRRIGNAAGFERAGSLCGGICSFSPERVGDRITLTVSHLDPETKHFYAIRSVGEGGELGAISNHVRVITVSGGPPGKIMDPRAKALTPRRIRLIFSAPGVDGMRSPPAEQYVIKQAREPIDTARRFRRARALCEGVCRFSPDEVGERLRLRIIDLRPGTTYHYAIRAKDTVGNFGPRSRSVQAATPEG